MMALAACSGAVQAATHIMHRDPNCGCCEAWADHVRGKLQAEIAVQNSNDMHVVKDRHGVPDNLRSCHTMTFEGYVIEGHVPAEDIARLLRDKPAGVTGLAVAGMPLGSPGMEVGEQKQAYQVLAFGPSGQSIFNSYN